MHAYSGRARYYENCEACLDQLLQTLREGNNSHLNLARPGLTFTKLAQAGINLCSHIAKNIYGEHVCSGFKLDDFYHSLVGKQKFTVRIDGEDALNVFIGRSWLQVLCEHKEEIHLEPLREHAAIWFYEYLKYFVEKLYYFEPDREHLFKRPFRLKMLSWRDEDQSRETVPSEVGGPSRTGT